MSALLKCASLEQALRSTKRPPCLRQSCWRLPIPQLLRRVEPGGRAAAWHRRLPSSALSQPLARFIPFPPPTGQLRRRACAIGPTLGAPPAVIFFLLKQQHGTGLSAKCARRRRTSTVEALTSHHTHAFDVSGLQDFLPMGKYSQALRAHRGPGRKDAAVEMAGVLRFSRMRRNPGCGILHSVTIASASAPSSASTRCRRFSRCFSRRFPCLIARGGIISLHAPRPPA